MQRVNSGESGLEDDVLDAGKMGKPKDLSDFDKGQIVMAKRLGLSVSETVDLVGCSASAVRELVGETDEDEGQAVSTSERSGGEKKGRRRPRKNPQI